jgi:uncharacterized peroxidase-related enzyme
MRIALDNDPRTRSRLLDEVTGAFNQARLDRVSKVLVVVANAQSYEDYQWARRGDQPGLVESLSASFDSAIGIMNSETVGLARRGFMQWAEGVNRRPSRKGKPPVDVQFAVLTYDQIRDPAERRRFNAIPTTLSLPAQQVDEMRTRAKRLLRESPEFRRFVAQSRRSASNALRQHSTRRIENTNAAYKIQTLPLLMIETAADKAKAVLQKAKHQLGFVPNMYGAMANEPAFSLTYAAFRQECGFAPVEQEVIFLVISRWNACHYCMAAHSFVADKMSKVPPDVTEAIRDGHLIADDKLQALAAFVETMLETRGRPTGADARAFFAAGYSEKNILGVVLAISVKTISNYTNHVFHTPVDDVFASRVWEAA